jgi:ADP-heptose:LPS heptosyltransferase
VGLNQKYILESIDFIYFARGMKKYIPGITLMSTGMLRYLDKILGKPASRILFLVKNLLRKKRWIAQLQAMQPKKILLIKLWGIGSVVLLSPVVNNLKKKYPHAEIHFLTKKWLHTIYDTSVFDKVYSLNTWWILNAVKDFMVVPLMLMKEHYDLVIDFEVVSYYTATLTFLINPKYSIGFKIIGKPKDKLYDFTAMYHESKHITEIFSLPLRILWQEDIVYDLIPPSYTSVDEAKISSEIPDVKNAIAVNVNASDLAYERRWPAKYYIHLIDALTEKWEKIILTGDHLDKTYVDSIYHQLKHKQAVINIAWLYTLKQFFVVIRSVKLFITNDSGPLHVAVAYQTPTISFFGPETPLIYGPQYKKELHKVFFENLYCSPCISVFRDKNFVCTNHNACMFAIQPEKVLQQVDYFLLNKRFK